MESYIQMFTKNAKIIRFLTIDVATTNNSALDVAEGAESGYDEDDKVVMEEESEKEKKPWKCQVIILFFLMIPDRWVEPMHFSCTI